MSSLKCWVPLCRSPNDKLYFRLPKDSKYKEIWLALTGKKVISEDPIYFCSIHFEKSQLVMTSNETVELRQGTLPSRAMPQMTCKTCLSTIPMSELFCVVSSTIPSSIPQDLISNLAPCQAEPLFQILTFCIPSLSLEPNPPSLVCIKCYYLIWQYFTFKLQCINMEKMISANLSPEKYGKVILCRSCPAVSGTRYFFLEENDSMGMLYKNLFLTKYPPSIVPLKVCLKCYNLVFKLTEFQKMCLTCDQTLQRCTQANKDQSLIKTFITAEKHQKAGSERGASTSSSSYTESKDMFKPSAMNNRIHEMLVKKIGDKCNKNESVLDLTLDPDMPVLVPVDDIVNNETPCKSKISSSSSSKRKQFTADQKLTLAKLMLKHSRFHEPNLSAIESAKMDLETWVKVIEDFHRLGNSGTLESIQSVWYRMKRTAKLAWNETGPMSYLDCLVNSYIIKTSGKSSDTDSTSSVEFADEDDECDLPKKVQMHGKVEKNTLNENVDVIEPKAVEFNIDSDTNISESKDDCNLENYTNKVEDVISVEPENVQSPTSSTHVTLTQINDSEVICIDDNLDQNENTSPSDSTREKSPVMTDPKPADVLPRPTTNKKKMKNKRTSWVRDVWTVEQKLQLVREIKKEYNTMVENNTIIATSKRAPWKNILIKLGANNFLGHGFQKLSAAWGKMKRSATIYEKNGLDIVDEEVWDLLQTHTRVVQGLLKKKLTVTVDDESLSCDGTGKKISNSEPPNKIQKLYNIPLLSGGSSSIHKEAFPEQSAVHSKADDLIKRLQACLENANSQNTEDNEITACTLPETIDYQNVESEKDNSTNTVETPRKETNTENSESDETEQCETVPAGSEDSPTHYKRSYVPLSDEDNLKILELIEEKFKEMLREEGRISKTVGTVLRSIKYKDYTYSTLMYNWKNLSAGDRKTLPTSIQKKLSQLIGMYNGNNSKQKTRGRSSIHSDKKKLDLIATIRTFGREVFQRKGYGESRVFWEKVQEKFQEKGYNTTVSLLRTLWTNMCHSAKLTWSQEGRKPRVGDQEIIDFMTEVIKEKEKMKTQTKSDDSTETSEKDEGVSINDNTGDEEPEAAVDDEFVDEGICGENAEENISPLKPEKEEDGEIESSSGHQNCEEERSENIVEIKDVKGGEIAVQSSTEYEIEMSGFSDHVSLADLEEELKIKKVPTKPKPFAANEVIEILDSDED